MVCLEPYFNTYKAGEIGGCLVNEILHFVQDDRCCYVIQGNEAARFEESTSGRICSKRAASFPIIPGTPVIPSEARDLIILITIDLKMSSLVWSESG